MKGHRFLVRLGFASAGLVTIWRGEASFRVQAGVALAATVPLALTRPGPQWVAMTVLAVGLVLTAEAINTALEHLADTVHPAIAPGIKAAKDAAAGAVLIASVTALGVGTACAYRVLS